MKSMVCQSSSSGVTQALGRKLGEKIDRGGCILLEGELGAGKTTFVQGLAAGLGISTAITSPTFVLMNTYPIPRHSVLRQLAHIDLYRLTSSHSLLTLDIEHLQSDPHTLLVVEWPDRNTNAWKNILGTLTFEPGELNMRRIVYNGLLLGWLR